MTRKKWILTLFVALPLLPILGLVALSVLSRKAPVLGVADGKLTPCEEGSENCVCSQSDIRFVSPLEYTGEEGQAMARLESIVFQWPRATIMERTDDYLRAEFRSPLFRFVDDVEFLLVPAERKIHVRSASRVGRSDLGANRKRIESLRISFSDLDLADK